MQTSPQGFWPSDWTAEKAAASGRDFAELRVGHGAVFYSEYRPDDGHTLLWMHQHGEARCLTPTGFSLRSRVFEYGGGAFCLTADGVAFVNEADQQVYLQALGGVPRRLTDQAGCRYGDLQFDAREGAILAVEERHGDTVLHRLIELGRGGRRVIAEGADFYAAPTLSPAGDRLAWIEWQRPDMPWTATRLCTAERSGNGVWQSHRVLAGGAGGESLQQPRFEAGGRLHCLSDRHGGWQPGWVSPDGWRAWPLAGPVDHAAAPWQLGACTYLPLGAGDWLGSRFEDGWTILFDNVAGRERLLAREYSRFRMLAADAHCYYAIAGAPHCATAVIAIDRRNGRARRLCGGAEPLPQEQVSEPVSLSFAVAGECAHGFFYPPTNAACRAEDGARPPLLVFLHGGPTSACYPVFDPRIQFWTQRGFAVADLNYRGSTGYGRAYRMRLRHAWGEVEVEDAAALVAHLADRGLIDPRRAFIRGASAGGYTALCALAFTRVFRGGASFYGVSDPLALRRVTHKFEADYLDWLIGDPQADAQRYRERSPVQQAGRIEAPVIFFQGGLDAVVVPEQTEAMVAALRARGLRAAYRLYPDERHGLRLATHQADAMARELAFYRDLLGDAQGSGSPPA